MESFKSQEKDYGTELGMIRRAPICSTIHPLESIEKNHKSTQEKLDLERARRHFGIGFALHRQHERAIAGCKDIGHFGFLKRSEAMHQSLTGEDLDFDFSDILNVEPEVTKTPYLTMESSQNKFFFRK